MQTFRGHKKEASAVAWHPIHEGAFASGGSDGAVIFWDVGAEKEVGVIEQVNYERGGLFKSLHPFYLLGTPHTKF